MTVSTELSHEEYTGNGVTTDFDFRYRILKAEHLVVSVADPDGTERILTNGTDYTLSGVGSYRGGKVILKMPLADGWKIGIARDLPVVQETDLRNQGKFFAEVHEDAFDYLTMLIQKSLGYVSLCLRKPSFISDHYDAKGNKISNLGKPVKDGDAVDLGTLNGKLETKYSRTLRVTDKEIPPIPNSLARRNKQLGFDGNGMPALFDPAETGALGYIFVDSFEKGAEITSRYQALQWESNGEYYRWDGDLPKIVIEGSTPENSGGVGIGAWVSVGDAALRKEIVAGRFKYPGAESVYYVPGIVFDDTTDNRDVAFSYPGKIYIPDGVTIRVNFLPSDDVRKFVGEGKLIVKNQWYGNDIIFDIDQATNGNKKSFSGALYQGVRDQSLTTIGIVGDSITDGAWGKQDWSSPATDGTAARNLKSPVNYNHSDNGGSHSWAAHWMMLLNTVQSRYSTTPIFQVYNASLSGAKLSDGWGYRNFDYGFFGNEAYGSKPPELCLLAMGWNDAFTDIDTYRDQIDMFVRKAWGYGCAVAIVTVNDNDPNRIGFERTTKKEMCGRLGIEYYDLGETLTENSNINMYSQKLYYVKGDKTWDDVHPQELGQMSMGNAMFMQTLGEKYVRHVKPGDVMNSVAVDRYWSAITYPSGLSLKPKYSSVGGTPALEKIKYLPSVTSPKENVTFTTLVYCENDGTSLVVLEPWNSHTQAMVDATHITVESPVGITLTSSGAHKDRNDLINSFTRVLFGYAASQYFGKERTLSTYCGQMRKGLNKITITYGGRPEQAIYPCLKFGNAYSDGVSIPNVRLSVVGNMVKPELLMTSPKNISDEIITDIMSGTQFSKTADAYLSPGSFIGKFRAGKGMRKNCYAALNYDPLSNIGVLVGCASDGRLAIGTWNKGEPTDWSLLGGEINTNNPTFEYKGFSVWVYSNVANSKYSYIVQSDDGRVNSPSFIPSVTTSGHVGMFNRIAGDTIVEYEFSVTTTKIG